MSTSKLTGTPVLPSDPLQLDHVPLWDIYHQLGINFGDRVFARIMDGDDEDAPLVNITYKKLYIDSLKVAQVLRERLGDEGKMTYAMLGVNSTYSYFVNIVAGWLNHWTVCCFICLSCYYLICQRPRSFYCRAGIVSQDTSVFSKLSMRKFSSQTPRVVKLPRRCFRKFKLHLLMSLIPKTSLLI